MPRDKVSLIPYPEVLLMYSGTSTLKLLNEINTKHHKDPESQEVQRLMAKILRNHMRGVYTEQGAALNYEEQLKARMSFQGF